MKDTLRCKSTLKFNLYLTCNSHVYKCTHCTKIISLPKGMEKETKTRITGRKHVFWTISWQRHKTYLTISKNIGMVYAMNYLHWRTRSSTSELSPFTKIQIWLLISVFSSSCCLKIQYFLQLVLMVYMKNLWII